MNDDLSNPLIWHDPSSLFLHSGYSKLSLYMRQTNRNVSSQSLEMLEIAELESSNLRTPKTFSFAFLVINNNGESCQRNWSQKELLEFVNKNIDKIDVPLQSNQEQQPPLPPNSKSNKSDGARESLKSFNSPMPKLRRKESWDINKDFTGSSSKKHNKNRGLQPLEWHNGHNGHKSKERQKTYLNWLQSFRKQYSNGNDEEKQDITAPACTRRLVFRDLRRLDLQFNNLEHEPVLLVRRHCIVLSFYPITAIILADCVLLLVPPLTNSLGVVLEERGAFVLAFESYLKEWVSESNSELSLQVWGNYNRVIPFEQCAVEGLLTIVRCYEEQELSNLQQSLRQVLLYFAKGKNPPVSITTRFRSIKTDISKLCHRIQAYKATLIDITEDEEEMAMMNLTFLKKKPQLYNIYPFTTTTLAKHEDIEELLESYLMDFTGVQYKTMEMQNRINNQEELYQIQLDTTENRALYANTAISTLLCAIAFGMYITSAFGMNLDNTPELSPQRGWFAGVTAVSVLCILVMYCAGLLYFRKKEMFPKEAKPKQQMDPTLRTSVVPG